MGYICQKTLTLFGTVYQPGEVIPADAVLGSRVRSLMTCGYIVNDTTDNIASAHDEECPDDGMVRVPVMQGTDEEVDVLITKDDAALIFGLMQETAEKAIMEVNEINDENILIVIHATDSRKSVKNAAKERASSLHTTI